MALLAIGLMSALTPLRAQLGNARAGAEVLRQRRCIACHSIAGQGGNTAPDLARRSREAYTPSTLAAQMWNHGPMMWRAMGAMNIEIPVLSSREVRDLYAYFYSLRYFDPPGDAARGKAVFISRQCFRCHALVQTEGPTTGPRVSDWPSLADPILWVQHMWNHGIQMADELQAERLAWPRFTVQQMVDLLVYLQNLPSLPARSLEMQLGDPSAGERVFGAKNCARCHTVGVSSAGKIDLASAPAGAGTLTSLAVEMWNHRPSMAAQARSMGIGLETFEANQMRDLLSYLFANGYFEAAGNAARGQRIVSEKRCDACHGQPGSMAPPFPLAGRELSLTDFAASVWQHGPEMLAEIERQGRQWPTLVDRNVKDLVAFLGKR